MKPLLKWLYSAFKKQLMKGITFFAHSSLSYFFSLSEVTEERFFPVLLIQSILV